MVAEWLEATGETVRPVRQQAGERADSRSWGGKRKKVPIQRRKEWLEATRETVRPVQQHAGERADSRC
jgi:hypothetical protein